MNAWKAACRAFDHGPTWDRMFHIWLNRQDYRPYPDQIAAYEEEFADSDFYADCVEEALDAAYERAR